MTRETIPIIVVMRDRFSMFTRSIEAIYAHTRVPFRLLVVLGGADQATRDDLAAIQAAKGNLTVLLEDRLLLQGESRNRGLRSCDERFLVVMENDTIVHDDWLAPMLECMRDEEAAVVTPLLWWYRGLHAAGGSFHERDTHGTVAFSHTIDYSGIRRRRVDYPENHCLLIDRRRLPQDDLFDEVEPFDVDLGLTLRAHGLSAVLEPRAMATYSAPPPLQVRDIPPFSLRWDWPAWEAANHRFERKWGITYDLSYKRASYRRQRFKLGLAARYPNDMTVGLTNMVFGLSNRLQTLHTRARRRRAGAGRIAPPHAAH
jgi:Glycosyl transferase family 2